MKQVKVFLEYVLWFMVMALIIIALWGYFVENINGFFSMMMFIRKNLIKAYNIVIFYFNKTVFLDWKYNIQSLFS